MLIEENQKENFAKAVCQKWFVKHQISNSLSVLVKFICNLEKSTHCEKSTKIESLSEIVGKMLC